MAPSAIRRDRARQTLMRIGPPMVGPFPDWLPSLHRRLRSVKCLEDVFQGELCLSRLVRRAGDPATRSGIDLRVRRVEVHTIEEVEHFGPELQPRALGHGKPLEE